MKPRGQFEVTSYTNESGTVSYRVTGTKLNGERVRKNYGTRGEADAEKLRLSIETTNDRTTIQSVVTRLTPPQIADAERAVAELKEGRTLLECVRWHNANYREPVNVKLLPDAYDLFIADKEKQGCRPDTLRNLKGRVGMFKKQFLTRNVHDILPEHIKDFIRREGSSHENQNNDRRAVSSFFSWSKQHKYCTLNPVADVDAVRVDQGEPSILALSEVRALLHAAPKYGKGKGRGKLVPYVVLGMFCAIRPRELSRLTWDDIDLKGRTVTIGAKVSKVRGRRIVEIPRNAVAWLLRHAPKHTPIKGKNWRKDFDALKEKIGYAGANRQTGKKVSSSEKVVEIIPRPLKPWPQDVLRHTGISHHFAFHKHEGKTAEWAGNSPTMIHKHYKGLVKLKEAEEFFAMRPDAKKIVKLPKVDRIRLTS